MEEKRRDQVQNTQDVETETPKTDSSEQKRKKRIKRWSIVLACILFLVGSVLGVLQIGVWYTASHWEHWTPDYEKIDLLPILEKKTLSDEDYETVYRQTGVTKLGIDDMLARGEAGREKILNIQDDLFREYKITVDRFNPFTYSEYIDGVATVSDVQAGDIIVTRTTRVSWWRYGHAALVVDPDRGYVVECIGPGTKSKYNSILTFADLADFMILRPKFSKQTRDRAAEYAKENLIGLTYRFSIGILSKKYIDGGIKKSQCAHLVWYAYRQMGIDLDSNGGKLVKPQDMVLSEYVELVQAFGFDLDRLWS
ncbi:MAG: hypothetical protein IJV85_04845 [Clostridia bacterium]|nr:hypothetical protein [Clostridia bacterium]